MEDDDQNHLLKCLSIHKMRVDNNVIYENIFKGSILEMKETVEHLNQAMKITEKMFED